MRGISSDDGGLRVAFFVAYPHLVGGMERVFAMAAAELAGRGVDVRVLVPGEGPATDLLRATGVPVVVVPPPAGLAAFGRRRRAVASALAAPRYSWRLASELRRLNVDVVHTGDQRGALLAGPAARLSGARLVWHVHAVQPSAALNWASSTLASIVVVPSAATAPAVRGLSRRTARAVLPNPVPEPPARWRPEAAEPGLVFSTARLHPVKGVDVLLGALARLKRDGRAVRAVIAGGTQAGYEADERALLARRSALGLDGDVTFEGFLAEPLLHAVRAAVYVQPSRHETFGLAAAEAMRAGMPVVVSAVGGLAELVDDGRTGLAVPPDDEAALAGALGRLLDEPGRAACLGAAAAADIAARFPPDRFVTGLLDVYDRARRRR